MRRYPLYGNVIVDSSNSTALGGTLTISNSCNTSLLNNRASIAFAVADISYGAIKKGLFSNNVDTADARITAIVDTVSPTVGTGLSVSISPNHANPPVEALRVQSNGNIGIGTQTPQFPLDVNGNIRLGTGTTGNIRFGSSGVGSTQAGYIDLVNNNMTVMNQQNGNLIFGTNNGEDMRILTNGNVGIGTQTPQFSLDVNGNARIGTTSTNTFTLFNNRFYYSDWISAINPTPGATALQSFITASTPPTIQTSGGASMYTYRVEGKTLYCRFMLLTGSNPAANGAVIGSGAYLILLPGGYTIDGTVSSFASPSVPTITSNSKIILQDDANTGGLSGTQIGYGWNKGASTATFGVNPLLVFAHTTTQIIIIPMSVNNIFGSGWGPVTQANCMTSVDFSVPIA